jgi:hypothetical protein
MTGWASLLEALLRLKYLTPSGGGLIGNIHSGNREMIEGDPRLAGPSDRPEGLFPFSKALGRGRLCQAEV